MNKIKFDDETIRCIKNTLTVDECLKIILRITEEMVDPECCDITNEEHSDAIRHYLKCIEILNKAELDRNRGKKKVSI